MVDFAAFYVIFSRSSSCPGVERQVSLDDEEFFVIEGSGVAGTPGV